MAGFISVEFDNHDLPSKYKSIREHTKFQLCTNSAMDIRFVLFFGGCFYLYLDFFVEATVLYTVSISSVIGIFLCTQEFLVSSRDQRDKSSENS